MKGKEEGREEIKEEWRNKEQSKHMRVNLTREDDTKVKSD